MSGLKRFLLGDPERISGGIYGTIMVMAVLAAGAKAYQHQLLRLLAIVAITVLVLWLAHVYARGIAESLQLGRRLNFPELLSLARHEYSIVAAAVLPVVALAFGASHVLPERSAVLLALWLGVVMLTAQGFRYARLERLRGGAAVLAIVTNLGIGLALVALEVWISHA